MKSIITAYKTTNLLCIIPVHHFSGVEEASIQSRDMVCARRTNCTLGGCEISKKKREKDVEAHYFLLLMGMSVMFCKLYSCS